MFEFPRVIKSHHHRPHPLREEEKGLGNMPMREGRREKQMKNREGEGQGDTVPRTTHAPLHMIRLQP